jgi:PEP-CTERM motif-containing protein
MKRLLLISVCVLLAMAASASAAKVDFNSVDTTTLPGDWGMKYGAYDYMKYDFSSGKPVDVDKGYYTKGGNVNPDFVDKFFYGTPGSTGGGGGGTGGQSGNIIAAGDLYYDLMLTEGKKFQFCALFYNDTYAADNGGLAANDVALRVRMLGLNDLDDVWHDITVAQLEKGIFMLWDVIVYDDDASKTVTMDIDFVNGAGTHPAGFFLDKVMDAGNAPAMMGPIPEPATLGLVMFGLAGVFVRRNKNKN